MGFGLPSGEMCSGKKNTMSRTLGYFGCPIKEIVHPEAKFCRHLLNLMTFKTRMTFFLLDVEHKIRISEELVIFSMQLK